MKRVLVTGGFGFLGSHLVEQLVAQGDTRVHVVDSLVSNAVTPAQFLSYVEGTITYSLMPLQTYFSDHSIKAFHEVYHLASVVGPAGVIPHAGKIVKSVVEDAYAVAAAAERWGVRLLDVSTSEVYGGGQDGLCSEGMPRIIQATATPRLEYAVAKLAAETALLNMPNLNVVIVRPFNVAGPRQSPKGGFVLPRFVQQAKAGQPLTVFGDGSQVRAFTHVRDTAKGLRQAMANGKRGGVYNIGNAMNHTTILGLANQVVDMAKSSSRIDHVDPKDIYGPLYAEASDKFPDPELAVRELGWAPAHDLDLVIADTLAAADV